MKTISGKGGVIVVVSLFVTLSIMIFVLLTQEKNSKLESTKEQAENITDMLGESAKFSMSQGITDIEPFVKKFKHLENVAELELHSSNVVRSGAEKELDDTELTVLKTKKPFSGIGKFNNVDVYRNIRPILAEESCKNCHQTEVGDALAIVNVRYSLASMHQELASQRIVAIILAFFTILITIISILYFNKKIIIKPIHQVLKTVKELAKGHVTVRTGLNSEDEVGIMAKNVDDLAVELEMLAGLMYKVSEGDVNISITASDSEDAIAPALNAIAISLQGLVNEAEGMIHEAVNGHLDNRGDAEKFKGSYKEIIIGFNATLDAVVNPLNVAAEYINRISKGDMPEKIKTGYKGDFSKIINNLNGCIDAINALIDDTKILSQGAIEGKLSARSDPSKHEGAYREVITGVNQTLDAFISPMHAAAEYMNKISRGIVPDMITDEYKGDFNDIKNSINLLIETITRLNRGIYRIAQSVENGNLTDRGKTENYEGEWRQLITNINVIINSLVSQIRFMAENINGIAKGEIPQNITDEYKGEYNDIRNNLNICFESVNNLITDVNYLSRGAIEGSLSTRADSEKHQGDFRKIIEGMNETLDSLTGPLNKASDYVARLSVGDIPEKITDNYKGEFNKIKDNLNSLINIFDSFVIAQGKMAAKHDEGWIDEIIDVAKFPGTYGKMALSINELVKSHIVVNRKVVEVVSSYSKGDFTKDMDRLPGQKARITVAVDNVKKSLQGIQTEIMALAEAAVEGNLEKRGNAENFEYSFKEMVLGLNKILDSVTTPIKEGVIVLQKMATGDLTVRIDSHFHGDHQMIKNSINTVCESLNKALGDVSEAIAATASASSQISSSTEEMAEGAGRQTPLDLTQRIF